MFARRSDGTRPWLRVHGEGAKQRQFPLRAEAIDALTRWERARPAELVEDPLLLPRLGRGRTVGTFPEAGGALSRQGPDGDREADHARRRHRRAACQPARPASQARGGGELSELQHLMAHASPTTTSVYVHHTADALERAVLRHDSGPGVLAEHERRRRDRPGLAGAP